MRQLDPTTGLEKCYFIRLLIRFKTADAIFGKKIRLLYRHVSGSNIVSLDSQARHPVPVLIVLSVCLIGKQLLIDAERGDFSKVRQLITMR